MEGDKLSYFLYQGDLLVHKRRYEEALKLLDIAKKLEPNNLDVYECIAYAYFIQEKYEEALINYNKAIMLYYNLPHKDKIVWYMLQMKGETLKHLQRYEDALNSFDIALEEAERINAQDLCSYHILYEKVLVLKELKKYNEALEIYNEVLETYTSIWTDFEETINEILEEMKLTTLS